VEAEFILQEEGDALQVPASALFRSGENWAVFRVVNGRAKVTLVELGIRSGLASQVVGGISAGDEVIIYPGDNVVDGTRVQARS
jgi:HlyD family secretion protein